MKSNKKQASEEQANKEPSEEQIKEDIIGFTVEQARSYAQKYGYELYTAPEEGIPWLKPLKRNENEKFITVRVKNDRVYEVIEIVGLIV